MNLHICVLYFDLLTLTGISIKRIYAYWSHLLNLQNYTTNPEKMHMI